MKQWRIGRAPDCDVILENSRVSRYHAVLVETADGLLLRDLGSSGSPLLLPGPLVIGIHYAAVGLRPVPVVDPAAGGMKIERIHQASGIHLAAPVRFIRDML